MSRVYVANYAAHDLSGAEQYTDEPFIFVTEGIVKFTDHTMYEMAIKLRDFEESDYLILSGSAAIAAMVVAILVRTNNIGSINVLLYNAKNRSYNPKRIHGKVQLPEKV